MGRLCQTGEEAALLLEQSKAHVEEAYRRMLSGAPGAGATFGAVLRDHAELRKQVEQAGTGDGWAG